MMSSYEVVWNGPVHLASGIGVASRSYVRALKRQGIRVRVGTAALKPLGKRFPKKKRVLIYHQIPAGINLNQAKAAFQAVLLNTVWETTRVPRQWLRHINRLDAVCVPSFHNKRALKQSGVKVPVFIVPHGVNTQTYKPSNKKLHTPQARGKFVFVSVFGFQHRKNPETLLRAYWEEFSAADNVLLVIKTNGYARYENEKWIKQTIQRYKERLGLRKKTAPVLIIGRHLTESQLRGIYTLGNVFVLPTRGEGVGLPFLESMASGVPVITTGWGGQMDFLNRRNSFLLPFQLQHPTNSMNNGHAISRQFRPLFAQKGQLWAEPDRFSLRKQMRFAYQHPGICKEKGRRSRQDVRKVTWDRAGHAFKRAIEGVLARKSRR